MSKIPTEFMSVPTATITFFPPRPLQRSMTNLELYELDGCPYCAKVIDKLDELDLDYESHMVAGPKSERDEVEAVSGQRGVPVLVDEENDVEGMPESDDIVEYLDETYGDEQAA
jgi:glutathione S-transferase